MKTIKTILIPIFALLLSLSIHAQKPNKEKIKALKVAHITEQLDLTTKEAQAFWPIYNANEEARCKLRDNKIKDCLDDLNQTAAESKFTEKEAKELLEKTSKLEEDKYKLQIDYISKLKGVLPAKKTLKLINAERSFRYKMIKEFKNRHKGEKK